jgi:hypothetical protein
MFAKVFKQPKDLRGIKPFLDGQDMGRPTTEIRGFADDLNSDIQATTEMS